MVTYCPDVEQGSEVFRALADPTRRALLDGLFGRDGQTLNELCEKFPEMTRFGVMKHLVVLAEANLVVTARQGRTKRHYLNPVPIEQVANRWISKYAARFSAALVALDDQVATEPEEDTLRRAEPA
jgi:DNA-binding transcriptional ArsR family regulator